MRRLFAVTGDGLSPLHHPRLAKFIVVSPNGCWMWGGATGSSKYGKVRWNGRDESTHRVCYEMERGSIPSGLEIDHLCKVKLCVNPSHLEAVTRSENMRRTSLNYCRRGLHELVPPNIYVSPSRGRRNCRPCHLAAMSRKRQPLPATPVPGSREPGL